MKAMWKQDIIGSAEQLREIIGPPHEAVVKKTVTQIDSHIENYIAKSPLFFLATSAAGGGGLT